LAGVHAAHSADGDLQVSGERDADVTVGTDACIAAFDVVDLFDVDVDAFPDPESDAFVSFHNASLGRCRVAERRVELGRIDHKIATQRGH
jgi:hypothetical protein